MAFDASKILEQIKAQKEKEKSSFTDQRIWSASMPAQGQTKVVYKIRVLPIIKTESSPWVRVLSHNFKTPTGWVNEYCPETIHGIGTCPFDDRARELYATKDEVDKKKAGLIYRKANYYANIKVIKDPRNNGANEGKVFIFKFGKKIFDKFDNALFPAEETGNKPIIFFDPKKGYDLNLIVTRVKNEAGAEMPNYDSSEFSRDSSPIAETQEEIDDILSQVYDLESEFLSPKKYKSYEDLKDIFDTKVMLTGELTKAAKEKKAPEEKEEKASKPAEKKSEEKKEDEKKASAAKEDEDFLANLEKELNS